MPLLLKMVTLKVHFQGIFQKWVVRVVGQINAASPVQLLEVFLPLLYDFETIFLPMNKKKMIKCCLLEVLIFIKETYIFMYNLTCVSVNRKELENSALSAMLRYCLSLNFFSSANSCCVVNGVRGFRFGLCFLNAHLTMGGPLACIFERLAVKK